MSDYPDIPHELLVVRNAAAQVAISPTHELGDVVLARVPAATWRALQRALVQAAQDEQTAELEAAWQRMAAAYRNSF